MHPRRTNKQQKAVGSNFPQSVDPHLAAFSRVWPGSAPPPRHVRVISKLLGAPRVAGLAMNPPRKFDPSGYVHPSDVENSFFVAQVRRSRSFLSSTAVRIVWIASLFVFLTKYLISSSRRSSVYTQSVSFIPLFGVRCPFHCEFLLLLRVIFVVVFTILWSRFNFK